MATAITALANTTLASAASTITFSSISGAYRDLFLVMNYGLPASNSSVRTRFNSDTGSNYSQQHMGAFSSSSLEANSSTDTSILNAFRVGTTDSGVNQNQIIHIFDYAQTNKHKSVLMRSNMNTELEQIGARWASTSAITTITFVDYGGGNFTAGSTFSLFGVSA